MYQTRFSRVPIFDAVNVPIVIQQYPTLPWYIPSSSLVLLLKGLESNHATVGKPSFFAPFRIDHPSNPEALSKVLSKKCFLTTRLAPRMQTDAHNQKPLLG